MVDATTDAFLQADGQSNETETQAGLLAENQSGNAAVAQLGRWFSTQHTFLQGSLNAVAANPAVADPVSQNLDPTQAAMIAALKPLTGAAFDAMYLTSDTMGHQASLDSHASYIASGTNPLVTTLATAEQPIIQDHLHELQTASQLLEGGAAPAVGFPTSYPAAPPLAAIGTLSAQDQSFINLAYNAATTGVDEGNSGTGRYGLLNSQVYGAWQAANDAPLNADVASLANALGATVPSALTPASTAQISTLNSLSGTAFDSQAASYAIGNYQQAIGALETESTTGSSPALVALATAALPTAEQLLGQAVILYGEAAGGLNDTTAAPNTLAGSLLNVAANDAVVGNAAIAGYDPTVAAPSPAANQTGIQFAGAANNAALPGYAFVIDTATAPATINGAASQFEAVVGGAQGMTYYGGAAGTGDIALTGGTNSVIGAANAGNYFVGASAGSNAVYAGNGNDTVATTGGTNLVGLGSGANAVVSGGNDTIFGSSGTDTIYATGGASEVFAGSKALTYVAGGPLLGLVNTGSAAATVFGGSGASISVAGAGANSVIVASAGNETLSGAGLTANAAFFGGGGSDVLTGGAGNDVFIAGSGSATISGGGGANLIQFIDGRAGGSDTVALGASDKLSLVGYGASAVQQAISSATTGSGGVSFTLSDNTHVTLTGVSTLGTTNFV